MVQMKNYITLQVIVLCIFRLSADDKAQKVPRVVEGSGKIIDVSEASLLVKKDGEKNMNELLYDIYKRFKKDTTGTASQYKREIPGKKLDTHAQTDNKLMLRDLESTIDKLIGSLTKVNNDGQFESKDISNGIQDLSKFRDGLVNVKDDTKSTVHKSADTGKVTRKSFATREDEEKEFEIFKKVFLRKMLNFKTEMNAKYHDKESFHDDTTTSKKDQDKGTLIRYPHNGDQKHYNKHPPAAHDSSKSNVINKDHSATNDPKYTLKHPPASHDSTKPKKYLKHPPASASNDILTRYTQINNDELTTEEMDELRSKIIVRAPIGDYQLDCYKPVDANDDVMKGGDRVPKRDRANMVIRIPVVGKKRSVRSRRDQHVRITGIGKRDQIVRTGSPGKKDSYIVRNGSPGKRDRIIRNGTPGKRGFPVKNGKGARAWIPTIGKREIMCIPIKREKVSTDGKKADVKDGNKLENLTVALVKVFNNVNERELFTYEKTQNRVKMMTLLNPNRGEVSIQSAYKAYQKGFADGMAYKKSNGPSTHNSNRKVENLKLKIVELFDILNDLNIMNNEKRSNAIKDVKAKKDVKTSHSADNDILDIDDIMTDLKDESRP